MRCENSEHEPRGSGALDIVLCMPIALFFLFVVSDGGLTLVEQGAVRDAVRTSLHREYLSEQPYRPLRIEEDGALALDRVELNKLLERSAAVLADRVREARAVLGTVDEHQQAVEVSAIAVFVDPRTGHLVNAGQFEVLGSVSLPGGGPAASLSVEGYPYRSRSQFISGMLREEDAAGPSYAERLAAAYSLLGAHPVEHRYLDRALFLYAEVRTRAGGINQPFVKAALGRFYALQVQHLQTLRTSLR